MIINNAKLCQMTMNAGVDLPLDYIIRHNLNTNSQLYKQCYIADGNMTSGARKFYEQFSNVKGIDSKWNDSYSQQYKVSTENVKDGEWAVYFDADEYAGPELQTFFLHVDVPNDINMIRIPCIMHLSDGDNHFYPAESKPEKEFIGQWTKSIVFKKEKSLNFIERGSHIFPSHGKDERAIYLPYPYFHFKTLEGCIRSDTEQAFKFPEGQQYTTIEAIQFKTLTRQYKTMKEFRNSIKDGTWSLPMQKFAYDTRNIYDRPISRLYWQYHILNRHPCFKDDASLSWDAVKQYIQSEKVMKLFEHNKANKIGEIVIEKDF